MVKKKLLNVFIDSDAFIALIKEDDALHTKTQSMFETLLDKDVIFATSSYVFSEVVTVLSQHLGRTVAIQFIEDIYNLDAPLTIYYPDEELQQLAIQVFYQQKSKNVSFVDCINMALLEQQSFDAILSFDKVYTKNGFKTVQRILAHR